MLFSEIAYGPIHSRRLGTSLGMEIMPLKHKLCSFNCVYCECGFNQHFPHPVLPTQEQIHEALEHKLQQLQHEHCALDVITFSGNGEPTLHPDFNGIIQDTCALRDCYFPQTKVSVLSNSTQLGRLDVQKALWLCDYRILKLDSAITTTMQLIDQPVNASCTVEHIIHNILPFKGNFILQTCFLRGKYNNHIIDNTTNEELSAWYHAVRTLMPEQVMIYVIDRATPVSTLEKIPLSQMQAIAEPLREEGYNVIVSA